MEWSKAMGYLKNSPDGRLLAAAHYFSDYVEVTDFNTTTGAVTNPKTLDARVPGVVPPVFDGCYGIEFSPDSRLLYVSSEYGVPNDTSTIYQFDVSLPTQVAIQASKTFITGRNWLGSYEALQLGPDKKIYVATYSRFLSVINSPNVNGTGCLFIPDIITIDDGTQTHSCVYGLPNFIQSYFNDPVIATGNCQFSNISFSLQNLIGITSVEWNFGDPASGPNNISTLFAPTHIFTQQGQYTVRAVLQNANGCGADTIYKIVHAGPFSVFLGNDTTLCQGDTLKLHMRIPNASNFWNNGSTDTVLKVTQTGSYWVKVSLGDCTASDTINVTVRLLPAFTLGNDSIICSGQSIILSPIPSPPNVTYLWNTGATTSNINTISDGLYWLKVTENGFGCKYADSLNATVTGADGYLWNTGATSPIIKVFQTGIYWADVLKDGCTFRDSTTVIFKPLPIVNLGNDSTLCESQTTLLDAGNSGSQYLWQDNNQGQTFMVTKAGNYSVKVTMNGCVSRDTIIIKYDYKPIFSLGNDKVICDGQTIALQPTIQNNSGISFLWGNGSTSPTLAVTQTGTYDLQLTNYCGSKSDEIIVSKGVCKLYIPSAFTPNNDGKNDVFKAYFGENVTSYMMEIYNRWGQKVFRATDLNTGWDGKINGIVQPHDSYIWVIKYKVLTDPKEYLLKGTVSIIR
jgi:gliding motility-associated-like protein